MDKEIRDVVIRRATRDDMIEFYGVAPPRSSYAWIAYYKGKPACMAGITVSRTGCVAYSDVKPDIDAPKRTVWLAAKQLLENIVALKLPMYAACDFHDKMAQKFVARLGFTRQRLFNGMEIFSWVVS